MFATLNHERRCIVMITVIIATKNRSVALREFSLSSLLNQDITDFEVLIWDASDDDLSEKAVDEVKNLFDERGIALIYQRALRVGSASQRNDAVRQANGDVIFFIDDDSEVSSSGIRTIERHFKDFKWLRGMAMPLIDKSKTGNLALRMPEFKIVRSIFRVLFFGKSVPRRSVRPSAYHTYPEVDLPGTAEWLCGGDMA
jgi:glycosyltransferase involved in cell wall biosynthesis